MGGLQPGGAGPAHQPGRQRALRVGRSPHGTADRAHPAGHPARLLRPALAEPGGLLRPRTRPARGHAVGPPAGLLAAAGGHRLRRPDRRHRAPRLLPHPLGRGRPGWPHRAHRGRPPAAQRRPGHHRRSRSHGAGGPGGRGNARRRGHRGGPHRPALDRPLRHGQVLASVEKTGRLVIAHQANVSGGFGAEIAARVAKDGFWFLEAPIERVGRARFAHPGRAGAAAGPAAGRRGYRGRRATHHRGRGRRHMLHDPSHYEPPPIAHEIEIGPRDTEVLRRLASELAELRRAAGPRREGAPLAEAERPALVPPDGLDQRDPLARDERRRRADARRPSTPGRRTRSATCAARSTSGGTCPAT